MPFPIRSISDWIPNNALFSSHNAIWIPTSHRVIRHSNQWNQHPSIVNETRTSPETTWSDNNSITCDQTSIKFIKPRLDSDRITSFHLRGWLTLKLKLEQNKNEKKKKWKKRKESFSSNKIEKHKRNVQEKKERKKERKNEWMKERKKDKRLPRSVASVVAVKETPRPFG